MSGPEAPLWAPRGLGEMTLRDYLAIHGPQPSLDDIAKAADEAIAGGWRRMSGRGNGSLTTWWAGLSLEVQAEFAAKARYAFADGMLVARSQ